MFNTIKHDHVKVKGWAIGPVDIAASIIILAIVLASI